jgi:branched-chain amino acid transport system ATP-binding protein
MLKVRQLNAYYGHVQVLRDISFEVQAGEIFTLIGLNGAGKSTLLSAISGVHSQKTGEIWFEDQPVQRLGVQKIVNLGMTQVPEGRQIFYELTVRENLMLGAYRHKGKIDFKKELEHIYEIFPALASMENRIAGTLSGGEQQMVAIGRGLMAKPKLLLLDEPSLGLAPLIIKEIFGQFDKLRKSGVTIIMVEQNANIALKVADRAAVLVRGQITKIDSAASLLARSDLHDLYIGTAK